MTSTTGSAMPTAPIDRNDFRALRVVFVAVLASVVLTACGGGAPTTESTTLQCTRSISTMI